MGEKIQVAKTTTFERCMNLKPQKTKVHLLKFMVNCFFSHFYQVCISKRFFHSRSSHFTFGSDCTVECLQSKKEVPSTSCVFQLKPFLDKNGLIRVGGRLDRSILAHSVKHPVIPAAHHLNTVFLRDCHVKSFHRGVEKVLATVRENFCILGDQRLLHQIKHQCVKCRRYDACPAYEEIADLPADRVNFQRPFSLCGVITKNAPYAWGNFHACAITRFQKPQELGRARMVCSLIITCAAS